MCGERERLYVFTHAFIVLVRSQVTVHFLCQNTASFLRESGKIQLYCTRCGAHIFWPRFQSCRGAAVLLLDRSCARDDFRALRRDHSAVTSNFRVGNIPCGGNPLDPTFHTVGLRHYDVARNTQEILQDSKSLQISSPF